MSIVAEIATPESGSLYFDPLGKPLRGRVDYGTMPEQSAFARAREFPRGIPGLRIELDPNAKTAAVVDPLCDEEWTAERKKLERRGLHPAEPERFAGIDTAAWLWWIQRGIAANCIRIVSGLLPKAIQKPERLLKEERRAAAQSGDVDQLRELVQQQGEQINRLVAAVTQLASGKA